jgi:hypothetical protein
MPKLDVIVAITAGVYRRGGPQSVAGDTALAMAIRAATDQ